MQSGQGMADEFEIRRLIENWALWRDMGEWDRLATVWHPEGRMVATWCEIAGSECVVRSRKAWDAGLKVLHMLGGSSIDIAGDRAVARTKMQIIQRATVHDILVEVTCSGRFSDALQRVDERWSLRLRNPVYEMDAMVPVGPGPSPALDPALLDAFPEGYRHLACLQTQIGLTVTRDLPGTRGVAADGLRARSARWLAGDDPARLASVTKSR